MQGNLYMNGNNIMGVKSISNTDSGMAIESEVSLNNHNGFILTVTTDPEAATVTVVDADSKEVEPIEAGSKTYLLSGIGDQYGVNVEYTGYTGKHLTITNNKDQTLNVTLEETPQT